MSEGDVGHAGTKPGQDVRSGDKGIPAKEGEPIGDMQAGDDREVTFPDAVAAQWAAFDLWSTRQLFEKSYPKPTMSSDFIHQSFEMHTPCAMSRTAC